MVIEDVDLIARHREQMRSAGEELLLNKLLNEMDGIKMDAETKASRFYPMLDNMNVHDLLIMGSA